MGVSEVGDLAAPVRDGRFWMASNAILLAVVEIRINAEQSSLEQDTALTIRDALRTAGYAFPGMSRAIKGELTVEFSNGAANAQTTEQVHGWDLNDPDRQVSVSIAPDRVALQAQSYTHYSETFLPLLTALLPAVEAGIRPGLRHRVGLRYVNRFSDPEVTEPEQWRGRIHDWLLGPTASGPLAGRIRQAQQQFQLQTEDGLAGVVRHGPFHDPAVGGCSYLWDLDVYQEATERFDPAELLTLLRSANVFAAKTYRSILTPAYLEQLGLEDKADDDHDADDTQQGGVR